MRTKAERSAEVVIGPPRFDFPPGILDRQELIGVETFIAQLAIEDLDVAIFRRLPRAQ
jgi:hypothetical protein